MAQESSEPPVPSTNDNRRFGDQEYELGSTEAGLAWAIRRMSELQREVQADVAY
jgi:hypothetical protein